jgi:hypothetical protein
VTPKRQPPKRVVQRRYVGMYVTVGGKALPQAHALYREVLNDGTVALRRGNTLRTVQGFLQLNARSRKDKKRAAEEYRPDMYITITAAAVLFDAIQVACLALDAERGLGAL